MRYISREDIAFYENAIVMKLAKGMVPRGKTYDKLAERARRRIILNAIDAAYIILNDTEAAERITASYRQRAGAWI